MTVLSHIAPANAIGEGVFSLDKSEYFVREGEALPVQIVRANGGTLAQDITVQVGIIDGTPGFDYPNATITQIVTFKAGTNPTSMPVDPTDGGFVTINHNRAAETDIHIQIQSVNGNGAIGTPQTALVHILGRGTPTVTAVFPRSGASLSGDFPITIQGTNFLNLPQATCPPAQVAGPNAPVAPPAPTANTPHCVYSVDWFDILGGGEVIHTNATLVTPTMLQTSIPLGLVGSLNDGHTYDLRVSVTDNTLVDAPYLASSPITSADRFTFWTGPTITNISPGGGPITGGTVLTLVGNNFPGCPQGMEYRFANNTVVAANAQTLATCQYLSANVIRIQTPNLLQPPIPPGLSGPTDVMVNFADPFSCVTASGFPPPDPGCTVVTDETHFSYLGAPTITAISPNSGPAAGGTLVTLIGTGFQGVGCPGTGAVGVTFGGSTATSCTVQSDSQMLVQAPPCLAPCPGNGSQALSLTVQITVKNNAVPSPFTTAANYTYVSGPVVTSLEPASGPPQGGGIVKIHGAGFSAGALVNFGAIPATAVTFMSSNLLQVTAPAGNGTVDVVVNVGGITSPVSPTDLYTYAMPVVTSIVPNAGPPAGGTVVLINGQNFTTNATVMFGATQVPATYISPVQLQATAPAGAAGVIHIQVATPNGTSAINTLEDANPGDDLFTYTIGPIIASLNPLNGPMTGGIPVIITGTNFAAGASVTFGGIPSDAVNFNSATQITALLPATGASGVVDVRVTTSGGISPVSTLSKFTYNATVPVITQIAPNAGPTIGGQTVNITGSGFLGVACPGGVKFGTVVARSCTVNSDSSITAVSPANVPGQTFLTVSTASGTTDIALNYTYNPSGSGDNGDGGGGGGTGGGGTGSVPGTELPAGTGAPVTYALTFRWTLLVWRGPNSMPVGAALQTAAPANGQSADGGGVTAIYGWDPVSGAWLAYFTGPPVPGANNLSVLTRGGVYWVAVSGPGTVTWSTTDG